VFAEMTLRPRGASKAVSVFPTVRPVHNVGPHIVLMEGCRAMSPQSRGSSGVTYPHLNVRTQAGRVIAVAISFARAPRVPGVIAID